MNCLSLLLSPPELSNKEVRCGHSLGELEEALSEWLATHSCFPEFRCSFPYLYPWRPPRTQDNFKAVASRLQDWLDQGLPSRMGG